MDQRDLTVRGLVHQLVHAFSSIDGRVLRSFRCLITQPGTLTVAWMRGKRIPYVGPFQLFLIANVLFFALQSTTHTNIFSSPLGSHLNGQDWSELARELVARHLENKQTNVEQYAPVFDQTVKLNAKWLVILMVLPFAFVLPVVFYRTGRPFATHLVFSLHFYAFLLLLFCVSLGLSGLNVWLGGPSLAAPGVDNVLTVINLVACAGYLYVAASPVYSAAGAMRIIKALALALAVGFIVLGYRFVIFLITLYST
jgi:hypothetical protein